MRLSISVDGALVRQGLEDLAAEIPLIGRRRIRTIMNRIVRRMQKPGAKPTYPIKWDSDKQRKAYFASNGFGHGIPYKRSNSYAEGWQIVPIENGYMIENKTEYAKYLGGDAYGQVHSGIHKGRWLVFRDVAEEELEKLPDEIEQEIRMVARRAGL